MDFEYLVEQWRVNGFVGPIRFVDEKIAEKMLAQFDEVINAATLGPMVRRNRHYDLTAFAALANSRELTLLVNKIIGEQALLWRSHVFTGSPGSGLAWHQDPFNTLVTPQLGQVTAHVAITAAEENNCVKLIPGSHNWASKQIEKNGFELIRGTDKTGYGTPYFKRGKNQSQNYEIIRMKLKPGEGFLFHPQLLHASIDRTKGLHDIKFINNVKKMLKPIKEKFSQVGLAAKPTRYGIGLRYCPISSTVTEQAMSEFGDSGKKPVIIGPGNYSGDEYLYTDSLPKDV
jgi:hypothetical protein